MNFKIHKKQNKRGLKWLLLLLLIIFLPLSYLSLDEYRYRETLRTPASEDNRSFPFTIEKGETPTKIAEKLQNENFILSSKYFLRYLKRENLATKIQAGRFFLNKNMTIGEITEILTQEEAKEIKIVFPEGFTTKEMDARLVRLGLTKEGDFLRCLEKECDLSAFEFLPKNREALEGYFFPDTYTLNAKNFSTQELVEKMLNNFTKRIQPLEQEILQSGHTLNEIVIMASILEEETKSGDERPMVADIFWRRLESGIPLGADATVRYFSGNKQGTITKTELQEDNPYNTRKNKGLTPTAICNPGLESLKATIRPKKNNFWYFLHDSEGQIHYASTLEEHVRNKNEWL